MGSRAIADAYTVSVHVVDAEIETVIACKCRLGVTGRIINDECAAVLLERIPAASGVVCRVSQVAAVGEKIAGGDPDRYVIVNDWCTRLLLLLQWSASVPLLIVKVPPPRLPPST